jgi:putative oxidoreductase
MKTRSIISITLRLVAVILMLQTLYFKFTAQPESIYIFSKVGIEPWGRILTGLAEFIASVLLLLPGTIVAGAFLSIMIMTGAIASHIFILGVNVMNDNGQLFIYACVVFLSSFILLILHKDQLASLLKKIK